MRYIHITTREQKRKQQTPTHPPTQPPNQPTNQTKMGKKGGGVRVKTLGPKGGAAKMVNPMEDLMVPPEDMVRLPPPPDRAYQIFWPIRE